MYDILRVVTIADNMKVKYALVSFPNVTGAAEKVFGILGKRVPVYTINTPDEAEACIASLKEGGTSLIIGDAVSAATAKKRQINSFIIPSGEESVQAAFQEAVRIHEAVTASRTEETFYQQLIGKSQLNAVAFNLKGEVVYSSQSQDQFDYPHIFKTLTRYIDEVIKSGEFKLLRNSRGIAWAIRGYRARKDKENLAVFILDRQMHLPREGGNAVEYYHMLEQGEGRMDVPMDNIGMMGALLNDLDKNNRSLAPVCLIGAPGGPFETVIDKIYLDSPWKMHTLLSVDCMNISQEGFHQLMEDEASPFSEVHLNILLKNITALSNAQQRQYLQYVKNTAFHKRNRLYYSAVTPLLYSPVMEALLGSADTHIIRLPALKDRSEDIIHLANLYLASINNATGRQVHGFEEGAKKALGAYSWPGNNMQLFRVLQQLVLQSSGPVITEADARRQIALEISDNQSAQQGLSLNGTLEEINLQIVSRVLEEEKGNKARTAERLGISRSTLWRMLG